jgi:hypothetical protein
MNEGSFCWYFQLMNAGVTKFMSQFKKSPPPGKIVAILEQEFNMLKALQRTKKVL